MAKNKQKSAVYSPPGMVALNEFVRLLNTTDYWNVSLIEGKRKIGGDYRPIQGEMRRLVRAWSVSGPNVSKLLDADVMLAYAIQNARPFFIPTNSGVAQFAYLTPSEYSSRAKPIEIALDHFIQFLLNPFNENLGGPCKYCDSYYVKKTARKRTVYCSEKCGHRLTSRSANSERRDHEHKKQLKLAKRRIAKWLKTKTEPDWKKWVSNGTSITKHWLTRAMRNGEIEEPRKPILT
jgi:hypothetical protein